MSDQLHSNAGKARETDSRSRTIDFIIGGSFISAGIAGITSAYNNIRHNFLQAFVYGYDNKPDNWFSTHLKESKDTRQVFDEAFAKGTIKEAEFYTKQKAWVKDNSKLLNQLIDEKFEVKGSNAITKFVNRGITMAKYAGKTTRNSALMGIASSSAVAIGAVAVLKHSKTNSDNMNALIEKIESKEQGTERT